MNTITLGLDVGGYNYAAAYVPQKQDEQPITIPLFPQDIEVRGAPVACRLPAYSVGSEVARFYSMKYEIDNGVPLAAYRGQPAMLTRDWIQSDLKRIRNLAEDFIGERIERVVITVAAQYSEHRRFTLRDCAQGAGFTDVQMINDGTAAAFAHMYRTREPQTVLVYSSGYNGFEAGLLRVVKQHYREISHESAVMPGGRYLDELLMKSLIELAREQNAVIPVTMWGYDGWFAFQHLVESLKKQLSVHYEVLVTLPDFLVPAPLTLTFTAARFKKLLEPSVAQSLDLVERLLDDAQMQPADLDVVILVGGTTRIEYIQKQVANRLHKTPLPHEDDLLARGAAIYGHRLASSGGAAVPITPELGSVAVVTVTGQQPSEAPAPLPDGLKEPDLAPILEYTQALIKQGDRKRATAYLAQLQEQIEVLRKQAFT